MKEIEVNDELVDYIEGLNYDKNCLDDLLIRAVKMGLDNTDAFKNWTERYLEANQKFEAAKNQISNELVNPLYGENVNWNLNYYTKKIVVED